MDSANNKNNKGKKRSVENITVPELEPDMSKPYIKRDFYPEYFAQVWARCAFQFLYTKLPQTVGLQHIIFKAIHKVLLANHCHAPVIHSNITAYLYSKNKLNLSEDILNLIESNQVLSNTSNPTIHDSMRHNLYTSLSYPSNFKKYLQQELLKLSMLQNNLITLISQQNTSYLIDFAHTNNHILFMQNLRLLNAVLFHAASLYPNENILQLSSKEHSLNNNLSILDASLTKQYKQTQGYLSAINLSCAIINFLQPSSPYLHIKYQRHEACMHEQLGLNFMTLTTQLMDQDNKKLENIATRYITKIKAIKATLDDTSNLILVKTKTQHQNQAIQQSIQQSISNKNIILLLDLSSSMRGSRINSLKQALEISLTQLQDNVNVSIIGFSNSIRKLTNGFEKACELKKPENLQNILAQLVTEYGTNIELAFSEAAVQIKEKNLLGEYLPDQTLIALFTDGESSSVRNIRSVFEDITGISGAYPLIINVGIGHNFRKYQLKNIANQFNTVEGSLASKITSELQQHKIPNKTQNKTQDSENIFVLENSNNQLLHSLSSILNIFNPYKVNLLTLNTKIYLAPCSSSSYSKQQHLPYVTIKMHGLENAAFFKDISHLTNSTEEAANAVINLSFEANLPAGNLTPITSEQRLCLLDHINNELQIAQDMFIYPVCISNPWQESQYNQYNQYNQSSQMTPASTPLKITRAMSLGIRELSQKSQAVLF